MSTGLRSPPRENWADAASCGSRSTASAVALFQTEGRVYAFADLCVHQDRSLFKGTLLHGKVICPGHQWQFDLETGYERRSGPLSAHLPGARR